MPVHRVPGILHFLEFRAKAFFRVWKGSRLNSLQDLGFRVLVWELVHFFKPFHIFLCGICTYVGSDESPGMEMDDEILQELEGEILIVCIVMIATYNTHKLFNPNKLEEGGQNTINPQSESYGRS